MALFIGGISRDLRTRDLEDAFGKYGRMRRCDIKGAFAFVTYEDERDAEDALNALNGRDVGGCRMNIEWARSSGRYDPGRRRTTDEKCYICGERGHFARDCKSARSGSSRRSRSRSRSPRRSSRRSRSRSPRREKSPRSAEVGSKRDRSRSPRRSASPKKAKTSRSPSPARSPKQDGNGDGSGSPRPERTED